MKKIAMALALLLAAASCDFLDVVPEGSPTQDDIYKTQAQAEKMLFMVYGKCPDLFHAQAMPDLSGGDDLISSYYGSVRYFSWKSLVYATSQESPTNTYFNMWGTTSGLPTGNYSYNIYEGIRYAYNFLNNIGSVPDISEANLRYWSGEAHFLIAHLHQILLEYYGPIVLAREEIDLNAPASSVNVPRSTYDECVNFIEEEFRKAADMLPDYWGPIAYGRAIKATALAYRARLLLYSARKLFNGNELYKGIVNRNGDHLFPPQYDEKKWELAAQAAKDVMNLNLYSLVGADGTDPYASFNTLFTSVGSGTGATEKIYTRIASGYQWRIVTTPPSGGGPAYGGYGVTPKQVDAFAMANGRYPITGYTDGDQARPIIDPDAGYSESGFSKFKHPIYGDELETFKMYQNREPRFYVNVFWSGMTWHGANKKTANVQFYFNGNSGPGKSHNYPPTGYLAHKFTNPSIDTSTGNYGYLDFPVFRYAEILLNYVEALNEYDPSNADITLYLNMIRKRAGVPDIEEVYPDAVGDQTRMRELIRRERQVELCFENLRYFDTRTWMTAETDNNMPVYGMNIAAKDHKANGEFWQRVICKYDGGRDGNRAFTKRCYLFPISQEELDRVKCTQNYGW